MSLSTTHGSATLGIGTYEGIRVFVDGKNDRNRIDPALIILSNNRSIIFHISEWEGTYESLLDTYDTYYDKSLCLLCDTLVSSKFKNRGMYPINTSLYDMVDFKIPESGGLKYSDGGAICKQCAGEIESDISNFIDSNRCWIVSQNI